jgi:hypothetical protein
VVPAYLKSKSEEAGGAFLLFEDRIDHGKVWPLYVHPDAVEPLLTVWKDAVYFRSEMCVARC